MAQVATEFLGFARALGMSDEATDASFSRLARLDMRPDDPLAVALLVKDVLAAEAKGLKDEAEIVVTAIQSVGPMVEQAARAAVGPIAKAAAERTRANLSTMSDSVVERVATGIRDEATQSFASLEATFANTQKVKVSATLAGAFAVVGIVTLVVGYGAGRHGATSAASTWEALGSRSDASTWAGLIANNTDIDAAVRGSCATGMSSGFIQGGSRACRVPLWLDPPAAPAVAGTVGGGLSFMVDWLNQWSALSLLGGGLLGGLLLRRIAKLVGGLGPVGWLLDL